MAMKSPDDRINVSYFSVDGYGSAELCVADNVSTEMPLQFDNYWQVRVITCGDARFRGRQFDREVDKGTLILIPPGEIFGMSPLSNGGFSCRTLRICSTETSPLEPSVVSWLPVAGGETLIASFLAKMGSRTVARATQAERAIAEFTSAVKSTAATVSFGARVVYPPAIELAHSYLRDHFAAPLKLCDLAVVSGLSSFYLQRHFTSHVGISPHRYQVLVRVLNARKLLKTSIAIAEVAQRTGFFDQSHFTSCFYRLVGVTPGRYQRDFTNGLSGETNDKFFQDTGRAPRQARKYALEASERRMSDD